MPVVRPLSLITAAILPAVLLSGCPGPTTEVRTTLCQEMTAIALGETAGSDAVPRDRWPPGATPSRAA